MLLRSTKHSFLGGAARHSHSCLYDLHIMCSCACLCVCEQWLQLQPLSLGLSSRSHRILLFFLHIVNLYFHYQLWIFHSYIYGGVTDWIAKQVHCFYFFILYPVAIKLLNAHFSKWSYPRTHWILFLFRPEKLERVVYSARS